MNNDLTLCELSYIFADKLVSNRSGFVNYDIHPSGEKISVKPLSYFLTLSALIYLFENSYIEFVTKEVKKMVFFFGKDIFVKKVKEIKDGIGGIEELMMQKLKDEKELKKVCFDILEENDVSPWGNIINIVKQSLVNKGYLKQEEKQKLFSLRKYFLVEEKISESKLMFGEFEEILSKFKKREDFELIEKGIEKGISCRYESDSSVDLD